MAAHRLSPNELHERLPLLLAGPGEQQAARSTVSQFENFLRQSAAAWVGYAASSNTGSFTAFCLILPGKVGFVLISNPTRTDPHARETLDETLQTAAREHPQYYAQALVEPGSDARVRLLESTGFERLTTLLYLERSVLFPWVDPPADAGITWDTFSPTTQSRFEAIILSSYIDSTDCPELVGKRPIEDILAAHKAGGDHDPSLWFIASRAGTDLGCILVNPQTDGRVAEIVYVGVAASARRQGIGQLLMQQALTACRIRRFEQLLVVVDERNQAAQSLYGRFAFESGAARIAYLLFPQTDAP
jgi:mycothiol synthase